MNGIEKITQQIALDTQAEIQEIQAKAQAEAEAITAQYEAQAQAQLALLHQQGTEAAAQRATRLASMAQMEARKMTLATKQELVGKAFDKALEKLVNLPDDQYIDLLANLVVEASRTGKEQVIFSKKDRARVGKAVVTRANDLLAKQSDGKSGSVLEKMVKGATALLSGTAMLTLAEETRPMEGGLVLRDDKVETNCSFQVLIHLKRDALAAQVAKVLF